MGATDPWRGRRRLPLAIPTWVWVCIWAASWAVFWSTLPVLAEDRAEDRAENRPEDLAAPLGILYEIRSPRTDSTGWLLGTVHSDDPRIVELPGPVKDALQRSGAFALEVVPDSQAILKSMIAMTFTDGRTLREILPEGLYRQTAEALAALGMTPSAYRDLKPWAVVTLLSIPRADNGDFLDLRLYRQALADSKPIRGLETIEEQLAVLDGLDERDQIALLEDTLANLDQLPTMFEDLVQAYVSRDLAALAAHSERWLEGGDPRLAARFRESAVIARNRRLAERMAPLFDEGGWFVAVGALHLPGERGILALLARQGYRVAPVY